MVNVGVLGQGVMNSVSLIVNDNILTQTEVVNSIVEGDPYSLDLDTLLRPQVANLG